MLEFVIEPKLLISLDQFQPPNNQGQLHGDYDGFFQDHEHYQSMLVGQQS